MISAVPTQYYVWGHRNQLCYKKIVLLRNNFIMELYVH